MKQDLQAANLELTEDEMRDIGSLFASRFSNYWWLQKTGSRLWRSKARAWNPAKATNRSRKSCATSAHPDRHCLIRPRPLQLGHFLIFFQPLNMQGEKTYLYAVRTIVHWLCSNPTSSCVHPEATSHLLEMGRWWRTSRRTSSWWSRSKWSWGSMAGGTYRAMFCCFFPSWHKQNHSNLWPKGQFGAIHASP